jgi:hypothetical protein
MSSRLATGTIVVLCFLSLSSARNPGQANSVTTTCDAQIPLRIHLAPVGQPRIGGRLNFEVTVESGIDPDLIQSSRIEYELPRRLRERAELLDTRDVIRRDRRRGESRMALIIPDGARYQIRARIVVELRNGKTISQTAIRWIDLGEEDPPEGMLRRLVDPDGSGIRVYQGTTVRR